MPTYEYVCKTCGHRFEAWQKITDDPLTECPNCHNAIRRVLFPAGVVFKGSGFYSTDVRKSAGTSTPAASAATAETNDTAKPETKSDSASESRPAASGDTAKAS